MTFLHKCFRAELARKRLFWGSVGQCMGLHVDNHGLLILEFLSANAAQFQLLGALLRILVMNIQSLWLGKSQPAGVAKTGNFCTMLCF